MIDPSTHSTDPQDGFGMLDVGGPLDVTITIKDANGRLVFELDPLSRTTVISKCGASGVPPSKEQGGQTAPKSRVVPVDGLGECDRARSRLVASGLLQLVEECHSRVQNDTKRQASLGKLAYER
jgi:hypothetical protein